MRKKREYIGLDLSANWYMKEPAPRRSVADKLRSITVVRPTAARVNSPVQWRCSL